MRGRLEAFGLTMGMQMFLPASDGNTVREVGAVLLTQGAFLPPSGALFLPGLKRHRPPTVLLIRQ
ncbi:hypothetical protein ATO1_08955 [Phaeobacter sp. 22II1-1F12B]|nr:hypothetical protein ATO1_08955 [Phaeobacter sp. 22II1-1F12B]